MTLAMAVGAITLGGLEATTVTVTSSTVLHLGSSDMVLQETIFDAIFKGLLPVGFVFLSYFLLQKKLSTSKIILILIAIAIVGVLIGFFYNERRKEFIWIQFEPCWRSISLS